MDEMLNERQLWNRAYISTFKDPTVAAETTQGNQTYSFKQPNQTHGDVENEQNLSPDWNPSFHYRVDDFGNTYQSIDQMEWQLLNPTSIEDIQDSPDILDNQSTTLINDFLPIQRKRYQRSMNVSDISTLQTQVGRIEPYSQWSKVSRSSSGQADR